MDYDIVSSVASEGLRRDYESICVGYEGGLQVVYDHAGTGKSRALQAVARAKSEMQPPRFLVINLPIPQTSDQLYAEIKNHVLGYVQDFNFSPEEVARVVRHGLCGPPDQADQEQERLPATRNTCRLSINAQYRLIKKIKTFRSS